jgi:hypothetical protein
MAARTLGGAEIGVKVEKDGAGDVALAVGTASVARPFEVPTHVDYPKVWRGHASCEIFD